MHITASLGIAIADDVATPESLLRDSDAAMYRAKERGRGRIEMFDEALRSKAERRLATASALHRALERGRVRRPLPTGRRPRRPARWSAPRRCCAGSIPTAVS